MTSPRTKIEALFNSGLFGCIRVSISPRPFFLGTEIVLNVRGDVDDLCWGGAWARRMAWKLWLRRTKNDHLETQRPGIGDGPMGSNWMMDIDGHCHEMSWTVIIQPCHKPIHKGDIYIIIYIYYNNLYDIICWLGIDSGWPTPELAPCSSSKCASKQT